MLFLPKEKTLQSCTSKSCKECGVKKKVNCHFSLMQLIHFCSLVLPSFIIGAVGLCRYSLWIAIVWLLILGGFFVFLEVKVLCAHCPHYAEKDKTLKCWANYSALKLWKYRPGPMNFLEKILFLGGLVLIWGIPLFVLIIDLQIFLLIIYVLTTFSFFITLSKCFCSICMNFACPLNRVKEEDKNEFFASNPDIAKAWGKHTKQDSKNTTTSKDSK